MYNNFYEFIEDFCGVVHLSQTKARAGHFSTAEFIDYNSRLGLMRKLDEFTKNGDKIEEMKGEKKFLQEFIRYMPVSMFNLSFPNAVKAVTDANVPASKTMDWEMKYAVLTNNTDDMMKFAILNPKAYYTRFVFMSYDYENKQEILDIAMAARRQVGPEETQKAVGLTETSKKREAFKYSKTLDELLGLPPEEEQAGAGSQQV